MRDIKLENAMLGWKDNGPAYVVEHPVKNNKNPGFYSVGACFTSWQKMTTQERLLQLYIETWHAVARDGVPPDQMHKALSVIPEYRDSLAEDFPV